MGFRTCRWIHERLARSCYELQSLLFSSFGCTAYIQFISSLHAVCTISVCLASSPRPNVNLTLLFVVCDAYFNTCLQPGWAVALKSSASGWQIYGGTTSNPGTVELSNYIYSLFSIVGFTRVTSPWLLHLPLRIYGSLVTSSAMMSLSLWQSECCATSPSWCNCWALLQRQRPPEPLFPVQ